MADDKQLKSSFELAMERLREKDRAAGVEERSVTDEQKAKIAEVRNFYDAKLAEVEILHQSKLRGMQDPGERETRELEFRRDREHLTTERDNKIEQIRSAGITKGTKARKRKKT